MSKIPIYPFNHDPNRTEDGPTQIVYCRSKRLQGFRPEAEHSPADSSTLHESVESLGSRSQLIAPRWPKALSLKHAGPEKMALTLPAQCIPVGHTNNHLSQAFTTSTHCPIIKNHAHTQTHR